jgi:hypothetical protein
MCYNGWNNDSGDWIQRAKASQRTGTRNQKSSENPDNSLKHT